MIYKQSLKCTEGKSSDSGASSILMSLNLSAAFDTVDLNILVPLLESHVVICAIALN